MNLDLVVADMWERSTVVGNARVEGVGLMVD